MNSSLAERVDPYRCVGVRLTLGQLLKLSRETYYTEQEANPFKWSGFGIPPEAFVLEIG